MHCCGVPLIFPINHLKQVKLEVWLEVRSLACLKAHKVKDIDELDGGHAVGYPG
jgi:hypothetical protein